MFTSLKYVMMFLKCNDFGAQILHNITYTDSMWSHADQILSEKSINNAFNLS